MRLSPDGQKVAVGVSGAAGEDVWLYDLKRGMEGHFSPDGRWLAYLSDESGPFEVYLRRFPIGPDRVQISNGGAGPVSWSSDGRELIYRGSGGLMSAKLNERDGTLEPTAHRLIQLT
jgi:serine/threonine-protein kinase